MTKTPSTPKFITLPNRGLIHLEGPDRKAFLQGLITNDIEKLDGSNIIYACLLTPQGKFLHDFFLHECGDAILIDCEGNDRAQDLYDRLIKFRMRKKVQISVELTAPVYAIFGAETGIPDPRHPDMGSRSFTKPDLPEAPFADWDKIRITLTIPDGSRDLIPEKSNMAEGNMDALSAIDYEKGCYIGQELTARMHYRGLGKRFLQTVNLADYEGTDMRSQCGEIGIALVKKSIPR